MDSQSNLVHPREFTRVRPLIHALVTTNEATLHAAVRDVSLSGISIITTALTEGMLCTVEMRREDAPEEPWITANGIVLRVGDDRAAIRFFDLVGVDSLDHLRGLILYHSENPDQVLAEFEAHWGLRPKVAP